MSDKINEAIKMWQEIGAEKVSGANTAERVSGAGLKIIEAVAERMPSEEMMNNNGKYFVSSEERRLLSDIKPIEFETEQCLDGIIVLDSNKRLYTISTSEDGIEITLNSDNVDLTKFVRFTLKIELNQYTAVTLPANMLFVNSEYPTEMGEYLYDIYSTDGGNKWYAILRWKNTKERPPNVSSGGEVIGAQRYYVDGEKSDNSGNGLSWDTAVKDIQEAIDRASFGDEVFVKGSLEGLKYLPTKERDAGDSRSKSFIMKSGVNVYGGFKGNEVSIYQREMVAVEEELHLPSGRHMMRIHLPKYRTILSGDLNNENEIDENIGIGCEIKSISMQNNASCVVVANNVDAELNGVDIYGGLSSDLPCSAIYSTSSSFSYSMGEITNCSYLGHQSSYVVLKVNLSSCIIKKCSVYCHTNSGAVSSHSNLTNVILSNHYLEGNYGNGSSTVRECSCLYVIAKNNTSSHKSWVNATAFHSCSLVKCVSKRNIHKHTNGHSIHSCTASDSTCCDNINGSFFNGIQNNCLAFNNKALSGAGFYKGTNINCVAINNQASEKGGGFYGGELINCTSVRNLANMGAGAYNSILKNTVVLGNKNVIGATSNVYNDANKEILHSAVENETMEGEGNFSTSIKSAKFKHLSERAGIVDGISDVICDVEILEGSDLIDRGKDELNSSGLGSVYDVLLQKRKRNTIDIGAIEFND